MIKRIPPADEIASRQFTVVHKRRKLRVRIAVGRPLQRPTGEYECPLELRIGRRRELHSLLGEDGMQALTLALWLADEQLTRRYGGSPWGDGSWTGARPASTRPNPRRRAGAAPLCEFVSARKRVKTR